MKHYEHVLHAPDVAPLANLARTAKVFDPRTLPTVLGHVWLKAATLSGVLDWRVRSHDYFGSILSFGSVGRTCAPAAAATATVVLPLSASAVSDPFGARRKYPIAPTRSAVSPNRESTCKPSSFSSSRPPPLLQSRFSNVGSNELEVRQADFCRLKIPMGDGNSKDVTALWLRLRVDRGWQGPAARATCRK